MTTGLFSFTPWQCVVFSNVSHKKAKKEQKTKNHLLTRFGRKVPKVSQIFFNGIQMEKRAPRPTIKLKMANTHIMLLLDIE